MRFFSFSNSTVDSKQSNSIQLELHDINRLFNSMDPSPFLEKDLSDVAVMTDAEALDLLEGAKDRIFTGPAFSLIVNRLEASCGVHVEMRKRGIRILVDGDPLADIRVLQDNKRFAFIMKDDVRYLPCEGTPHVRRLH